jgi:acetone carboxylase gamma subunit
MENFYLIPKAFYFFNWSHKFIFIFAYLVFLILGFYISFINFIFLPLRPWLFIIEVKERNSLKTEEERKSVQISIEKKKKDLNANEYVYRLHIKTEQIYQNIIKN